MAKGDSSTPKTQPDQTSQMPQQNQTLSGNPSTDNQAQTRWMDPNQASPNTGINGGGGAQQAQNQPINNGTMLGQITAGNQGTYMPGGYDMGKFNDPNKHDPKYDVGRILSKYAPGPEGLQAAAPELQALGYRVVGKDKIQGPAGLIDVGQSFSDPNAQHSWYWSGDLNSSGGQQPQGSMLGSNSMNPQSQNDFLNQMFQQMMSRRNSFANQQFNPMGGSIPNQPMIGTQPLPQNPGSYSNQQSGFSYIDPQPQFTSMLNQLPQGMNPIAPYGGPQ